MFLIRQAKAVDVATLVKLARMVYFISLPPEERLMGEKVTHSSRCFVKAGGGAVPEPRPARRSKGAPAGFAALEAESDMFMFTMEDLETGGVIGTSQVRAHQGGAGSPNWSLRLSERRFFSETLGQGTTHTVAKLHGDESGPSEIGGLILQPSHRGHRLRPGRFLSFVRFHFMALHRELFAERVLAEMMPPVTSEGDNAFWDALGRKFIPVRYSEADRFCQHNRRFIAELMPKEEIYLTLLPLEIQNMVGVVAKETLPARRLLEELGFRYRNHVDPFDGGPYLEASTDSISLVRETSTLTLGKPLPAEKCEDHGIVSVLTDEGEFRAVEVDCDVHADRELRIPAAAMEMLEAKAGAAAGFTPLRTVEDEEHRHPPERATKPSKKRARRVRA